MLAQLRQLRTLKRFYSSALYVTGDKAQNNYVVLVPHIDFEEQLRNKPDLIKNIQARQLKIDLEQVESRWHFYKKIHDQKYLLETTRQEINNQIFNLKDKPNSENEIDKLIVHAKIVKEDLKNIRDNSYGIEEKANLSVLSLPNKLHRNTPIELENIIFECFSKPLGDSPHHLQIASEKDYVEYISPTFCYLRGDASRFEFSLGNYLQQSLLNSEYTQFSNADFARSIIVDGCGDNFCDKNSVFTLQDPHNDQTHELSRLHLVGGASLCSFMAYFSRHTILKSAFPLRFFSIGRRYKPSSSDVRSLFDLDQQSVVQTFVATDDSHNLDALLEDLTSEVRNIYEKLGQHFRLVYLKASELELAESLRLSIQMYSNSSRCYVEVGYLSLYDDYLSKRLLFNYKDGQDRKFCKVIAGQLINVHKCLGCVLENNFVSGAPLLTDLLRENA